MEAWIRIRQERDDLTDYVIHLTKRVAGHPNARAVLLEIIRSGHIRPTFARLTSEIRREPVATVKGPEPAVCLTEQPISALLKSLPLPGVKYSGYGIAFHKYHIHTFGGRPVLYGTERELGRRLLPGEPGYEEGKEVYTGGLPPHLQYLWVRYHPNIAGYAGKTVDFTWEREWRINPGPKGLELPVHYWIMQHPMAAVVVEKDEDVPVLRSAIETLPRYCCFEVTPLIVSLETARRELPRDARYARIETWPRAVPEVVDAF